MSACRPLVPLIDLTVGLARGPRVAALGREVGPGTRVVVVVRDVASARQLVRGYEAVDVLRIDLPAWRVVLDDVVGLTVVAVEGGIAIAEHETMHALRMLEVEVDAPFLAEPFEEGKVRFVVLDLKVPLRIALIKPLVQRVRIV